MSVLQRWVSNQVLILDGAMGTMLQSKGLMPGECPEWWNLKMPQAVEEVHRAYVEAGAHIIQTNTFGANRYKLKEFGLEEKVKEINQAAVKIAQRAAAGRVRVAVSMGPTGLLPHPWGPATFDDFYQAFKEQAMAAAEAGADLISIETMSDLLEIKAAVIAVKENTSLPVLAQMNFQPDGRTLMGTDARTAAVVLDALDVDALGANCSGGPAELLRVLQEMAVVTDCPLVVQPNAGLPQLIEGRAVYTQTPEQMAEYALAMVEAGAWVVGGCCGTTPEHIRWLARVLRGKTPRRQEGFVRPAALASRSRLVLLDDRGPLVFIGERINPTARKKLAADIREGRMEMVVEEARTQVEAGAPLLDVNMGVPGIDEAEAMRQAVMQIQTAVDVPLSIDSANPEAIEAALKVFAGKALINSVNGKKESLESILPLAKKYGAAVLGLALDAGGLPATAERRLEIARAILEAALEYGLRREDLYIDCLVQTVSAQQEQALQTLEGVRRVKSELGLRTILGVSNVSHGLPAREVLNATFLAMAYSHGLDMAILNPFDQRMRETLAATAVLLNRDPYCQEYVSRFQNYKAAAAVAPPAAVGPAGPELAGAAGEPVAAGESAVATEKEGAAPAVKKAETLKNRIQQAVIRGERERIEPLLEEALREGVEALELVNEALIPGIEEVGRRYEEKVYFLPQLILSAETMKTGFSFLRPRLSAGEVQPVATIVMATVEGDIHDIGKNIVAVLMENYGFRVVDLGKDVPAEEILQAAVAEKADLIGLSALMTTTMPRMAEVISEVKKRSLPVKVIIGGAVVTGEYARKIGADAWATDAREGVLKALELVKDKTREAN